MTDLYAERRHQLPMSYLAFIERCDGWEGDLGDDLGYVALWDRETLQERYDGYGMAQLLGPRWFPFGSNGGGEVLCFDLSSGTDRVYWVPTISMSDEEAVLRYESFADVAAAIPEAP